MEKKPYSELLKDAIKNDAKKKGIDTRGMTIGEYMVKAGYRKEK